MQLNIQGFVMIMCSQSKPWPRVVIIGGERAWLKGVIVLCVARVAMPRRRRRRLQLCCEEGRRPTEHSVRRDVSTVRRSRCVGNTNWRRSGSQPRVHSHRGGCRVGDMQVGESKEIAVALVFPGRQMLYAVILCFE